MAPLLESPLLAVHHLSAAAWFGALVYRLFFVDPKAAQYFGRGPEYERFAVHLAHGMRGVVLAALLTCGLSGFVLMGLRWPAASANWLPLMGAKATVWTASLALFAYISWVFWPRRLFAVEAEYPRVRRQAILLALSMIAFAGLGILLGQLGQTARLLSS